MGIQINGQTDTISANDGGLNINNAGITTANNVFANDLTANDLTINNLTGVAATFTGVLTYEDVTNIDAVGIITANSGIHVSGIVTAKAGAAVTYYGDGSGLTGVSSWEIRDTWLYYG